MLWAKDRVSDISTRKALGQSGSAERRHQINGIAQKCISDQSLVSEAVPRIERTGRRGMRL
jgi:hypothetical protein